MADQNQAVAQPRPAEHDEYERKPAFQLGRFKKNLHADFNEEFGELLLGVLNQHEELPSPLYAFRQKLDQRLHDGYAPAQVRAAS